ncbi:MAG TPA: FoF1 ATP synthase subunit a [Patescibacteria group bacterium]|nr:FoF1 ATP synthase subunit a [Patescibacteria group bacterium]
MHIPVDIRSAVVLRVLGLPMTNTFVTSILVTIVLTILAISFSREVNKPKSVFVKLLMLAMHEWIRRIDAVTHNPAMSRRVLPLIATFFLFILTANLLALFPGFLGSLYVIASSGAKYPFLRSPNTDLSTTLALAVISVAATQYFSLRQLKLRAYLGRFINFGSPLKAVIGFFELVSELTKLLSFSFRLFGNMFAGEVLLLICAFLVPFILPVPFMALEVFVGFIQAFIFATLTLSFISISTGGGEEVGKEVLSYNE